MPVWTMSQTTPRTESTGSWPKVFQTSWHFNSTCLYDRRPAEGPGPTLGQPHTQWANHTSSEHHTPYWASYIQSVLENKSSSTDKIQVVQLWSHGWFPFTVSKSLICGSASSSSQEQRPLVTGAAYSNLAGDQRTWPHSRSPTFHSVHARLLAI